MLRNSDGNPKGWVFQGRTIYPQCFTKPTVQGYVYSNFRERYPKMDLRYLPLEPGKNFGDTLTNFNPIKTSIGTIYLVADIELCFQKLLRNGFVEKKPQDIIFRSKLNKYKPQYEIIASDCDSYSSCGQDYSVITKLPLHICQSLAPSFPGKCVDAAAIDHSIPGGSSGADINIGFYGIFEYQGKYILAPLVQVESVESLLEYLSNHLDSNKK